MDNSLSDRAAAGTKPSSTMLNNHAHAVICLIRNPRMRIRDIANEVGLTERMVHRILDELEYAGVSRRVKEGRSNMYLLSIGSASRHPLESDNDLVHLFHDFCDLDDRRGQVQETGDSANSTADKQAPAL